MLEEQGYDASELRTQSIVYLLLTDTNGDIHLLRILPENKCISFSRIVIHDEEGNSRLLPNLAILAQGQLELLDLVQQAVKSRFL